MHQTNGGSAYPAMHGLLLAQAVARFEVVKIASAILGTAPSG